MQYAFAHRALSTTNLHAIAGVERLPKAGGDRVSSLPHPQCNIHEPAVECFRVAKSDLFAGRDGLLGEYSGAAINVNVGALEGVRVGHAAVVAAGLQRVEGAALTAGFV